jgi:hypothetical protein
MPAMAAASVKRRSNRALKRFANVRRPLKVAGWHSSVTLEDAFWDAMQEIAVAKGIKAQDDEPTRPSHSQETISNIQKAP